MTRKRIALPLKVTQKEGVYIGRRLLFRIDTVTLRTVSKNPTRLYIRINYLVPNIFIRLPSYDSTAKMRRSRLTYEDHRNKATNHRSHCA